MAYRLSSVAALVHEHLERQPSTTVRTLARRLGIERHTIQRALRARFRVSFRDLQRTILEREVRKRLTESPLSSIKEIAIGLGYQHPRSLTRWARRSLGESPTAYRKRYS